ncbi:MAG TPA: M48 family metalloprotease [Gaiellaceae bacterium]|nr:M48 family metalloprotease [Gaiellaceae bacterium]
MDAAVGAGVLAAVRWTWPGRELWDVVAALGWAGAAAAWAALVLAVSRLVQAPLSCWRGWWRERRWGFSTQSLRGWLADQGKELAVSVVFLAGAWTGAVGLARALPGWWAVPAAAGAALAVLLLSFVAPVLLEPLFNRFRPLADEALAAELRALAERAGVPVRDVLVADASRRTTKLNAYVSGIGSTRRVVVFDTLLEAVDVGALRSVVAHELGHRRERDVVKLTAAGMACAVAAVALVWAVLGTRVASPRELPVALLLLAAFQVVAMPFGAAWSRRLERRADRWSLELTHDLAAFERAHLDLARRNLADLAPPRLAYLFLSTHPTPRERLAAARDWAAARA